MEETKEKILADKMSGLSEENRDAINNAINESLETADAIKTFENDSDVQKLKAQEAELMNLFADPKIMKAYKNIRSDIYGVGERRQVTQKEKKKKKAKRRMAKKSRR
jgi:TRAP-type C4-dicarboxylate transport system substrate-binding protein